MPRNTRRGSGGHSYREGPYERAQNERGGRGRGRGRGSGGGRGPCRGVLMPTLVVAMEATRHTRVAVMVIGVRVSALVMVMVVVEATHHTPPEFAVVEVSAWMEVTDWVATIHLREVVGLVELELEGQTSMKALVVLLAQHFGLVVRVTRAFMQPGDMMPMAEDKAIPTMTILSSGINNGMERMVTFIRNMMASTLGSGMG
ncbi:hypothetical protein FNYG_08679 [Fusarium nygamai]|uniref:Uncharacterized protein n=1 Tax=Gibberella nygamai TaxID=42673 RepID=A0A2K0W6P7_GIBNY|nr:hypothetical protein FNYG_08679 [Fusarium nygamai]